MAPSTSASASSATRVPRNSCQLVTAASASLIRGRNEAVAACSLGEFVAAAALLSFFVILHRRAAPLLRGTALAIAGSSIFVALALTVFLLRLTGPGPEWLLGWSHLPALLLAPAAVLALSGLVRFFALLAANPSPPLA